MPPVVIENPILNSPYRVPSRHFRFSEDGITSDIVDGRRRSTYFVPIPQPRKKGKGQQLALPGESWTAERMESNDFINRIREHVDAWRRTRYQGVTRITRELLDYWQDPERQRPLFFCQIEALETAIFLAEVAGHREPWIENRLREGNDRHNPGLYRIAFKMATGSGKTVVMAMLIAWQALNKLANPQDKRFSDAFLVVTPGITIRDRLRVLLPNDPGNFYLERDIVTPEQHRQLGQAKILITNYHAFIRRDTLEGSTLTKKVLAGPDGETDRFKETPDEMVRRILRSAFGSKRNVIVLNDEAHHCYQSAPPAEAEGPETRLTADEKAEAKKLAETARVWLEGLRAVQGKVGIRAIYDLSATPFFLRGSGYKEGTLFPWVVSDFSLIDAIESGVVKIPRVPVADDSMTGESPTYRDLWVRIREELPRKGRTTESIQGEPILPKELEGALTSLYGNYRRSHEAWQKAGSGTPPVFIVVCSNTNVSKAVFDWIAGWRKELPDGGEALVPGNLDLFSNVADGRWIDRPNTLLIDSAQLESGDAMDPAFKKIAAAEIEEFKREFRLRYPGRSVEEITDEDLLREVMNTIGKPGRLGEQVRCVVSVSMLTEGWDANTVTHILGVRAFGTQLLCEQVVGRGLRRVSYDADPAGMFEPEYAEVYGVPFSFIPTVGSSKPPTQKQTRRVYALPERAHLELTFPRVVGYRFALPTDRLSAAFTDDSTKILSTEEVPTLVEVHPIAGERVIDDLGELERRRDQEVIFRITKRTLDTYFRADDGSERPWLFGQLLPIVERWYRDCVVTKDGTFKQMLLLSQWERDAADRIHRAISRGTEGERRLLPILAAYDAVGSTRFVDFSSTKAVFTTEKSHLNSLVLDSTWEAKVGFALDHMPEVIAYAKNQGLNLKIPYTFEGEAANYLPDLLVRFDDGGPEPLNLIVEVTGERKKEKAAKVAAAQTYWIPAVNNHGGFGRWAFYEVTDPENAATGIRDHVRSLAGARA